MRPAAGAELLSLRFGQDADDFANYSMIDAFDYSSSAFGYIA